MPITGQIIQSIAAETKLQIKPKGRYLLCKKCLTFCSSHKAGSNLLSIWPIAKYYGCRLCRQSSNVIKGSSIAVLDNQMNEEWSVREIEFWVNWLIHRKPFDFNEVKIVQATDREVEEFAMQVGNDTDELRQPRYKEMYCIISSGCKLSANTLNILKHTFKTVKEV